MYILINFTTVYTVVFALKQKLSRREKKMYKTIFELLEETTRKYPDKIAFTDSNGEITYKEFVKKSKIIGTSLSKNNWLNKPIAIYLDKNINCLTSMIGINYSGNFYTIIDNKMPLDRILCYYRYQK